MVPEHGAVRQCPVDVGQAEVLVGLGDGPEAAFADTDHRSVSSDGVRAVHGLAEAAASALTVVSVHPVSMGSGTQVHGKVSHFETTMQR
ncbi:hypothetical protein GCM10023403_35550 [Pseudonocardia benzenivorans]